MTEPEQPDSPPLTRRQLREMRHTGAIPVITDVPSRGDGPSDDVEGNDVASDDGVADAGADVEAGSEDDGGDEAEVEAVAEAAPISAVPLPRAAVAPEMHEAPIADSSVDLGVSPLTRRQARQQERIRTASVPVITPEIAAAHGAPFAPPSVVPDDVRADSSEVLVEVAEADADAVEAEAAGSAADVAEAEVVEAEVIEAEPEAEVAERESVAPEAVAVPADETREDASEDAAEAASDDLAVPQEDEAPVLVNPLLGSALLEGESPAVTRPPSSFDQLLDRSSSSAGSVSTPNALILSQTPSTGSIMSPLSATGEVLVTDIFHLPEGLSSTGHVTGTADGKDVDAVLIDGEIPAHSSPTPIAASAAISTIKTSDEIIRPPAPEKGHKWVLALAITAGVLALAIVTLLGVAIFTGVFQ